MSKSRPGTGSDCPRTDGRLFGTPLCLTTLPRLGCTHQTQDWRLGWYPHSTHRLGVRFTLSYRRQETPPEVTRRTHGLDKGSWVKQTNKQKRFTNDFETHVLRSQPRFFRPKNELRFLTSSVNETFVHEV